MTSLILPISLIRAELIEFLRNSDVLPVGIRGVTTTTSSYVVGSGEAAGLHEHVFSLGGAFHNFRYMRVDGVNYYPNGNNWGLPGFTPFYSTQTIWWTTPYPTAGQTVTYSIDWGSRDSIYPDMPRDDLSLSSFPRIALEMISLTTDPLGLGGYTFMSEILYTIHVVVPINKDTGEAIPFGGREDLETTHFNIRTALLTNAKNFRSFEWIQPVTLSPFMQSVNSKLLEQSCDYLIRFKYEQSN